VTLFTPHVLEIIEEIISAGELTAEDLHEEVEEVGLLHQATERHLRRRRARLPRFFFNETIRALKHSERHIPDEAVDPNDVRFEVGIRPWCLAKDRIDLRPADVLQGVVQKGTLERVIHVLVTSEPRPCRARSTTVRRRASGHPDRGVHGSTPRLAKARNVFHNQQPV
jgi:hypothetical protein